jgi:hypothetical protein
MRGRLIQFSTVWPVLRWTLLLLVGEGLWLVLVELADRLERKG